MKTVLVTGGCGFIGSNFIRLILKSTSDWNVINLDAITYAGNPANNADYQHDPRYQFVRGSICDDVLVCQCIAKSDAVINFAAESHVDRSIEFVGDFLSTNILGLKTLLSHAMKRGIDKFLHISTDEVYGSLPEGTADEHYGLFPNSPYSASKASADLLARAYWKTFDYPIMIARSSNNFGPFQYPEKVIPLFITNLMEGKKVPLYGKGLNRREWIFVEDNCLALLTVFLKGQSGQIYNVSSGYEITNKELTEVILKEMGYGEEMIEYVKDRPGHDFRYSISCDKVRALGFKPKTDFHSALLQTIQWYKNNKSWWQPLKNNKFTLK